MTAVIGESRSRPAPEVLREFLLNPGNLHLESHTANGRIHQQAAGAFVRAGRFVSRGVYGDSDAWHLVFTRDEPEQREWKR